MIRRLNYTGRKRIPRENLRIGIFRSGDVDEFDAVVRCDGLHLPASARVFVEAYHKSDWMRFDYGSVAEPAIPRDRRLTAFYRGARVLFRVKVVSSGKDSGKILAEADRILPMGPDSERERDPLLPVRVVDGMEEQIWRVGWENGPILELNRREPEIKRLIVSDARFKWLVLPQVLRSVLVRILAEGGEEDDDPLGDGVEKRWMDFALSLHPVPPPKSADRDMEFVENWVDDVVAAFCARHRVLDDWKWALKPRDDLFGRI
jgi:hypothetical protein